MTGPPASADELAGYPDAAVEDDLTEWDYGRYEGISTLDTGTISVLGHERESPVVARWNS